MTEQVIIICRTHFADQRLLDFARQVEAHSDYKVVFAIDEKNGLVDTAKFDKISLSKELCTEAGLYSDIGDVFWRCGDYPFYLTRLRYPETRIFWQIEYDVAINEHDPVTFFKKFDGVHEHDFLSTHFRKPEQGWEFGHMMMDRYDQAYRSYFPLIRLSGRAIDFAYHKRREASQEWNSISREKRRDWPNDEVFIATELQNNGYLCVDFHELGKFYSEDTFSRWVMLHPKQLPRHDGMIYHSVRDGALFLRSAYRLFPKIDPIKMIALVDDPYTAEEIEGPLRESLYVKLKHFGDNPARILGEGSAVATVVARQSSEPVLRAVVRVLADLRMQECLQILRMLAVNRWWPQPKLMQNIALAKPAWQSSISPWSLAPNPRADAEGGNNGNPDCDFGFHTDIEPQPWWTVDLQHIYFLRRVRIYNRLVHSHRLNDFRLLSSFNGYEWHQIYESPNNLHFTEVNAVIDLDLECNARFLRIQIPRRDFLHFRELEAFGKLSA